MYFPAPDLSGAVKLMSLGYQKWLLNKYSKTGFVAVESGDVVVDCGAFVGGFSLSVGTVASHVFAIEPAPDNFEALSRNVAGTGNIECSNIGFFDQSGSMPMNLSSTYVDNSLLTVDAGEVIDTVEVQLERLDVWAASNGLECIDFLKLEAEGVEPEIAESIGNLPIRKIAADCGPEREGQPTATAVISILRSKGYTCRTDGKMVFALSRSDL